MDKTKKVISHMKKDIAADKGLLKYEEHKKSEKKHNKKKDSKKLGSKKKHSEVVKRAMKHPDVLGAGAAKRRKIKNPKTKVEVVMKEFKNGTLNSGSGQKVTNPKQAIAIGLSEARKAGAKIPKKRK